MNDYDETDKHASDPDRSPDALDATETMTPEANASNHDPENSVPTVSDVAEFVVVEPQSPWSSLMTVGPVLAFVLVNARFFVLPDSLGSDRAWFAAAVAISVGWSLLAIVQRRRKGLPAGRFLPVVTAWLVFRGFVGILTANEDIYFGLSIAAKVAIGIGLLVSVAIGRDVASSMAPHIFGFSQRVRDHASYRSAMRTITIGAAVYDFIGAGFDVWLLFVRNASANEFVLVRYAVNWGASLVAVSVGVVYLARKLRRIDGFPGLMAVFEAHVEAQAERLGWDLSEPDT